MNYFFTCIIMLLILSTSVSAQDTTLLRIRSMKEDTTKCAALAQYAKSIMKTDPKKSEKLYTSLIQLGKKLNEPEWIGLGWYNVGYIKAKEARDREAISDFKTALDYFKKAKNDNRIAASLLNIANCLDKIGDMEGSIKVTLEAIQILEKTEQKSTLGLAYNGLGVTFHNLLDYVKAEEYFKKTITLAKEIKDTGRHIFALYGAATCMASAGKFRDANAYADEALKLATAFGQDFHLCIAHECVAEVAVKEKRVKPAIENAQKALAFARMAKDAHYELIALITLSDGYALANDQRQRLHYLNIAKDISESQQIILQMTDIYKGLSETYTALNNDKEAFAYYKKHIFYRDSLKGERDKNNVTELEARYQTTRKEKLLTEQQLAIAKKEVDLRKSREVNTFSIGAATIALLCAASVFLHYRNRRRLHQQQLQTLNRQKELQLMQAAMEGEEKERSRIAKDLHDGVAGMLAAAKMQLSSLSMRNSDLANTKEFSQAVKLLDDSSHEVRMTSHNLMPEILMQHGLDEAIQRFCNNITNDDLMQIQYAAYGTIGRYALNFELTVYRIVQELLNNIVKHSKATAASVQLSLQDSFLTITIEDNGIGFDKSRVSHTGTGLKSLQRRIQAMNGTLEIDTHHQQGVTAFIELDTKNYKL